MPAHILIVDADAAAARVTRAIVERAAPGALLAVERDVRAAFSNLQHGPLDILILDPTPHPLVAAQLAAAVKRQRPGAQVVVLASAPTAGLRRQMLSLGVDLYLEKPAPLLVDELRRLFHTPLRALPAGGGAALEAGPR